MGRRKAKRWSIKSTLTCLMLITMGALSAVGAFAMLYFAPQLETELAFYSTEFSKPASTMHHEQSPTLTPADRPELLLVDERPDDTPTAFQPATSTITNETTTVTTTPTLTGTITVTPTVSATLSLTTTSTTTPQTEHTPSKTPSKTPIPYKTSTRTPTKTRVPSSTATSKPKSTITMTLSATPQISPTRTNPPPPATSPSPTITSTPPPTTPTSTATVPSATPTSGGSCITSGNSGFENTLINLINNERTDQGLDPLTKKSALTAAARSHSEDMACNDFLSHTGSDGSRPADRVAAQGYSFSWVGENIYAGGGSHNFPNQAFNWWMNSTPHRANLLNSNYQSIGIGYKFSSDSQYGGYFTAVFARP